eukprot:11189943-Heterocapsa_arctica.AAC.1
MIKHWPSKNMICIKATPIGGLKRKSDDADGQGGQKGKQQAHGGQMPSRGGGASSSMPQTGGCWQQPQPSFQGQGGLSMPPWAQGAASVQNQWDQG